MFSPMGMEERIVPQAEGLPVLLIGRGAPAVAQARELLRLRSGLELTVVLDGDAEIPRDLDGLAVHHGFIKVLDEKKDCVDIALLDVQKNEVARRTFRFALVDYNSYTTQTRVTRFLESAGVTTRAGYIAVDQWGATGIPGVVAAGNVVTPVSGVLTALSTAFSAGLSLFAMLHKDRFGKAPYLYPWLPAEGLDAHPLAR
jgi:thioredoxin reductase